MPGYLGGGGSSGGVGGEISFPKEFIDPVTKFRISNPENLIDTDFEYGLQPTKWETVELINNTPSFFSKSGDTTIDGIVSIFTNAGTKEITVKTALEHGLAAGIPINVQGTKSITADGAYIINSIPDPFTFTYLCKDFQPVSSSIEDLYSSIITGEFFQGSQLKIESIETDGVSPVSTLTVTTASTHGFNLNTPFYFLNLNSTISQEFPSANTETRSFDSSNSATAQTFDGSNTQSSINIDLSNSATIGGVTSAVSSTNPTDNTITVSHSTESFAGKPVGTALYYNVTAGSGFFAANPRGVVFLLTTDTLGASQSTFQVSEAPAGIPIDIQGAMTGTFQLANQARTFAGNNIDATTETSVTVVKGTPKVFDGANELGTVGTVTNYNGNLITVSGTDLDWYTGSMVRYDTTGTAASGLTNGATYFVDSWIPSTGSYVFTVKNLPNGSVISGISGGSGVQTFTTIGVSLDKDLFHIRNHGFQARDMLLYEYPENGRFEVGVPEQEKELYFVSAVYDAHNFTVNQTLGELQPFRIERVGILTRTAMTPTTVTPVGLTAPVTYALFSGTLPNGLSLNTSTGVISGSPLSGSEIPAPGREVVIVGTDSLGTQATQVILFQIDTNPIRAAATFTDTFTTPDNLYVPGDVFNFSKSTGQTNFPVRNGQLFRMKLYGASGGGIGGNASSGGILDVQINLNLYRNQTLYFFRGGQGGNSSGGIDGSCGSLYGGGYNGGGPGAGTRGPGGGGRTDLRITTSSTSELLVAGGGGGGYNSQGPTGNRVNGSGGCTGSFGGYCGDNGGGGGGYYGGSNSCGDDPSDAGSGTNYYDSGLTTQVYQNVRTTSSGGGNSGNGYFTVEVISAVL